VDPGSGSITSLIQSLNTPLVAAGQYPAENVQSWILTRGASGSAAEVFVYFHLTESNQAVLYRWDGGPVPGPNLEQVVEEAMGFCESMGFMMDNLNFGQLPPDKRGELLQKLPPFVQDLATLQKEAEEIPLSMSKKVIDPVEEFARARAAMQGQPTANDFADPNDDRSDQFDPMSLMEDVGGYESSPAPVRGSPSGGEDLQIEITEIEGLELMPAAEPAPVPKSPPARMQSGVRELDLDFDEPPLVVGSAPAPAPVSPAPPPPPPPMRVRERTPPGEITLFDDASSVAPPMAAAAASRKVEDDEFNVDDLLSDVDLSRGPTNGAAGKPAPISAVAPASALDIDVSSALDDILDGVESSKSSAKGQTPAPIAPPAAPTIVAPLKPPVSPAPAAVKPVPAPAPTTEEISLDLDFEGSLESSISSPDEALVALEALGVPDDPLAALGAMLDDPPMTIAPPASVTAAMSGPPPTSRPAVEAAWSEAPKANGNGSHNGAAAAPMKLDISTDELARLLSML